VSFRNVVSAESSFNVEFRVQAQHPSQDPGPSSRQFQVGGFAAGGFNSDVVGQWNTYVDIRGDSGHWDDIEHVGPEMPTTWNVAGVHPNSQTRDIELDMGLDLALNGHSVYQ
jgi:hypothetical protein